MCLSNSDLASSTVQDASAPPRDVGEQLIADLVAANHILYDKDVVDAFGHVSVRHDADPERYLMARAMPPGQVTPADIVQFTLDSTPLDGMGRKVYLERFIHGEIYRAHPDVQAVVHSHSPAIVPLTISRTMRLRAVCHMAGFIGTSAPVFEVRDVAGDGSDLLIRDANLGQHLARQFSGNAIVLMRGHGSTVVAGNLRQAVYRAVYAEINARYQSTAATWGDVTYLSEAECRTCTSVHEAQVERPWSLWKAEAEAKRSSARA